MTYSYCFLPQFLWLGFFALFFGVRDYYFVSNLTSAYCSMLCQ